MTTKTEETPILHIATVHAEHFRRWTLSDWRPFGRHVKFHGKNNRGKTTALEMVRAAITGDGGKEPIQHGQDEAKLLVELQDSESGDIIYKIKRVWSADGSTELTVMKGGVNLRGKSQAELKKLADPIFFRPSKWIEKRPQDQLDDVLRIFDVKPPVREAKAITGETNQLLPNESAAAYLERLSADGRGIYFVRRTEANRIKQQKEKAFEEFAPILLEPDQTADEDLSGLLDERQGLDKAREARRGLKVKADADERLFKEKERKLADTSTLATISKKRIADLERQLAEERANLTEIEKTVALGTKVVPELKRVWEASQFIWEKTPDPSPRIAEIDALMLAHDENRQAIAERKQARETAERLKEECDAAGEEWSRLNRVVGDLRELRANMLNGVDMGVEGLAVGDGELRLGDGPFEQGSTAQQVRVAIRLFCRMLKVFGIQLGVVILDNAEKFDDETEAAIVEECTAGKIQALMAFVSSADNEMRVEIVEKP